ncbi:UbiA prenyltransferase family-domain-containing protein [Jackrogersella minutella]|nr:UbiA prenyltransferase family-domain-containing protein [Jackrogersella minutella]
MAGKNGIPVQNLQRKAKKPGELDELAKQYGGNHAGGWVSYLPPSWIPYVQLARLSPPAGLFLIYFPHLFGLLHASIMQNSLPLEVLKAGTVMMLGSLFFSNAIHIWNDLIDAPIDKLVARTRKRPIPRGAVSPLSAFIFAVTQAFGAALVLLYFLPVQGALYAAPNMIPTAYYPWAKRHTQFAQVVLGIWLAWGVFMGSVFLGAMPYVVDFANAEFSMDKSATCLYFACVLWTVIYDTIYAHQDIEDDKKIGMKSLAVLFGDKTKPWLSGVLGAMILALSAAGQYGGLGLPFYCLSVIGSSFSLGAMITMVDLADSTSCWWWFRYGFWATGALISTGLLLEYISV